MVQESAVNSLKEQLNTLIATKGDDVSQDDISVLIDGLRDESARLVIEALFGVAKKISTVKFELSEQPDAISDDKIPNATIELEAVVKSTEEAANKIMDAAENIQNIAENVDEETQAKLSQEVTNIFEASNFQDLTGQRIRNVIDALVDIDVIINEMMEGLSDNVDIKMKPKEEQSFEDSLMNGPQNGAPTQDEIDKLFDS